MEYNKKGYQKSRILLQFHYKMVCSMHPLYKKIKMDSAKFYYSTQYIQNLKLQITFASFSSFSYSSKHYYCK